LLLGLLADPRQSPWKQELRALAEVGDEEALEAVLRAAETPPAAHQALRAVRHIHARQPQRALARLLALLSASEQVALRPQLLKALGQSENAGALPALAQLLDNPNPSLAGGALAAIDRLAAKHPLPPELNGPVRAMAREAMNALAVTLSYSHSVASHWPDQVRWLEPFLSEEASRIQRRILLALGIITDRRRLASIARQLEVEGDRRRRANALEAIEFLAGPDLGLRMVRLLEREGLAVLPLAEVVERLAVHPSAPLRACLAYTIGVGGFRDCLRVPDQLTMCGEFEIREAALQALWRLCGEEALPLITRALRDPHPFVRRSAQAIIERKAMLSTIERMLFLKSVPLFVSLEGDELVTVSEICTEQEVPAETTVFRENDEGNDLYVVVSGRVKVFRGEGAAERPLAELGERECFGEMALLDSEARSASIATLEPCRFLVIRGEEFRELVLDRPKISFAILRLLSQRLRKADELTAPAPGFAAGQGYM
jgi:CRP/FNR family cyclic AMP-dependent transcriptional regulator